MGDQLNLCRIPNSCFIVGLVYQKKEEKYFYRLWLFRIRHRRLIKPKPTSGSNRESDQTS